MRARTIPNVKSPTGQHGFDYDIIKEFHKENLNIINDQLDLLTSESERLTDENDKLADEITSLNQEITQLSSLLNSYPIMMRILLMMIINKNLINP